MSEVPGFDRHVGIDNGLTEPSACFRHGYSNLAMTTNVCLIRIKTERWQKRICAKPTFRQSPCKHNLTFEDFLASMLLMNVEVERHRTAKAKLVTWILCRVLQSILMAWRHGQSGLLK